jgi:hypothetical protein
VDRQEPDATASARDCLTNVTTLGHPHVLHQRRIPAVPVEWDGAKCDVSPRIARLNWGILRAEAEVYGVVSRVSPPRDPSAQEGLWRVIEGALSSTPRVLVVQTVEEGS